MILKYKSAFGRLFCLLLTIGGTTLAHGWNYLTPLSDQIVCPGDTAYFTTTASGPLPYQFKWYKNGTVLSGKTNNSLTLSNVSSNDAGTYTVILTGGYNKVTNSATLTVSSSITLTPLTNLVRAIGASATFATTASGAGPFSYVWQKDGVTLSGRTNNTLTLVNLNTNDTGAYTVLVNGKCSSGSTSATLVVTECVPAVDVVLVIDRSGSMAGTPYNNARVACSNFVQNLNLTNDQAGLVYYNTNATLGRKLTNDIVALNQAIASIPSPGGKTSITLGIQTAQSELASARHNPEALPVMVLLSDGLPTGNDNSNNVYAAAVAAKNAGTRVFTVGFGSVNAALLRQVASSTNDFFYGTNSTQLAALFDAISTVICRPPTNIVVAGPTNTMVCPGSTATFMVTASGCNNFTYQWTKAGSALAGQTNSFLLLTNVMAEDAGVYAVEVSSSCRNLTNSAALTVLTPAAVEESPISQTACPGSPASFHVVASGNTPLDYQWRRNGTNILGATNDTFTIASASEEVAGWYDVIVNNTCGAAISASATLTLNTPVTANGPTNQTACPGGATVFSVSTEGTGPFSYAWLKGDVELAGQTNNVLALTSVGAADAGTYSVIVSGACGSVTNSATLSLLSTVTATPLLNQTNCPGSTAVFSTVAGGTGPFTFAWLKNASPITGQISSMLTLTNVSANEAGTYSVVVSGACGSITNSAALTVLTPVSATGPINQTNCAGSTAIFSTVASGTGPFGYQWLKAGTMLGTTSTLTISNVSEASAGLYTVIVSGTCNSVTNSAALAVATPVSATAPLSQTNCPGSTAVFSTVASGTGPFSYQWMKGASVLGTASTLTISNVTSANAGLYTVIVSGACNSVTNAATLTVNTSATATGPISQTNCVGSTAIFSTAAGGTGPFSYQWFKGGTLLGTTSTLTISNVSTASAGLYSVIVSGACNSVTNTATLTVNTPVTATSPVSQTNCPGTTAMFSTVASGTSPFNFQWLKGETVLGTSSTLTISNVSAVNAGLYTVIVSSACNSVTNSATLTVNTPVTASTPLSQTNCVGSTAVFSTVAGGTGPFSYQWVKGGTILSTASTLALTNVTESNAGLYAVIVSGTCNSVTNTAMLTVNMLVTATSPVSQTNCPGTTAVFSTIASGTGPISYQWLKDEAVLGTSSTLTISNVSAANAGFYTVIVSGACNSVTNTATLTVNTPVSASEPASQTNCLGSTAVFGTVASGTGPFTYQWTKGGNVLATSSTLTLSNVTGASAGLYSVIVNGACGSVTNSATLSVNAATAATSLAGQMLNPSATAMFTTLASGTPPFSYVWRKDGSLINGQTGSSLTLSNVTLADEGTYSVEVTGACGSETRSAVLHINRAPTTDIFSPTNGTVFVAPASFSLLAHAADSDGEITKVEFFSATNKLGEVTNVAYYADSQPVYLLALTNLPAGTNVFTAVATDNLGATGTSAPVSIVVAALLPISPGVILYDPQHDPHFVQQVTITNPTPAAFDRVRIFVNNLTNVPPITVYNASGTNNGVPFVDAQGPIPSGGTLTVTIIYNSPKRVTPNPLLTAILLSGAGPSATPPAGTPQPVNRGLLLADRSFMVEFLTTSNASYAVLYSSDLVNWKASKPYISGTGSWIQWVDIGQPLTESAPAAVTNRFYRVIKINP